MMPVSVISSPGIQILTKSSKSSTSSILGTLPLFSCKITLLHINVIYNFVNISFYVKVIGHFINIIMYLKYINLFRITKRNLLNVIVKIFYPCLSIFIYV